jgi:hypothetical protein
VKTAGNQCVCPEKWVVFETSAIRMTGYAEILFAGKLTAAKPFHHSVHTKQLLWWFWKTPLRFLPIQQGQRAVRVESSDSPKSAFV